MQGAADPNQPREEQGSTALIDNPELKGRAAGAATGAAAGAVVGGPVGALAGGLIGQAVGGLVGAEAGPESGEVVVVKSPGEEAAALSGAVEKPVTDPQSTQ
jgi:phage tail tape-measure protein